MCGFMVFMYEVMRFLLMGFPSPLTFNVIAFRLAILLIYYVGRFPANPFGLSCVSLFVLFKEPVGLR